MAAVARVGLIGAGRWGTIYLRTLRDLADRCRLTHLCTRDPAIGPSAFGGVKLVARWQEVVSADCDAVIIATPPATHAEMLEACLEAGKPCLVEKPLCLDVPTAERLHQRVQASGVPVLVDHTHLFSAAYEALKRALESGGEAVRVIVSEGMAFGPFRAHTPALWDWCPHDVSLCLDLLGSAPAQVEALGGPVNPEGLPEQVSIRLDFRGGACAWIHAGRLSSEKRRLFSVLTDHALYVVDDQAPDPLTVSSVPFAERYRAPMPEPLERRVMTLASPRPALTRVVTYFLEGVAGGDRARFGTELALQVVRVLALCEEAMRAKARRG